MTTKAEHLIDRLTDAADAEINAERQTLLMDAADHIRDTANVCTEEQLARNKQIALDADFSEDMAQGEVCAGCTRIGSLENGLCRRCADVEAIRKNTGRE